MFKSLIGVCQGAPLRSFSRCLAVYLSLWLFGFFRPLAFAESHARATAVLVNEFDARQLKRASKHRQGRLTRFRCIALK